MSFRDHAEELMTVLMRCTNVEYAAMIVGQFEDSHRAKVLREAADELLPVWEAMYEPGNVSDYLIGYTNSEAAAKGAAIAWLLSEGEFDPARLEWIEQPHGDRHDRWFDLIENHDDGIPTDTGINVKRRLAEAAAPGSTTEDEQAAEIERLRKELDAVQRRYTEDTAELKRTVEYFDGQSKRRKAERDEHRAAAERAEAKLRKIEHGCETPESHNYGCPCETQQGGES